jgi:hypothetical protein
MIQPARTPRRLAGSGLRALHVSLNSPVVALASLPNGPASAAVALDGDGAMVCLRSIRAGRTVFFASSEEIGSAQLALDAAVSFAESMGFLLDDDEVSLRGPEAAARLWEEICGDAVAPAASEGASGEGARPAASAPWLDALVQAVVPEVLELSKFRFFAASDAASTAAPHAAHADTRLRSAGR